MLRLQPRRVALLLIVLLLATGSFAIWQYGRGAALVVQSAGLHGWPERAVGWHTGTFTEHRATVATRGGAVRARIYRPVSAFRRTMVLVPGVHAAGIDEPRLVGFARSVARQSVAVVTAELADLAKYEVTSRTTDTIEDAVLWTSRQRDLSRDGLVGLMGISFGGGLAVATAGRPSIRDKLAYVFSFGGYGDFPRVLRYLCSGILPDGSVHPPHDYGVVIVLLGAADRVVPPEQVEPLRNGIRMFLQASHVAMYDQPEANRKFEEVRKYATTLPEPAATFMNWVNARDVKNLGSRLLPVISSYGTDPVLSAERSAPPKAPVFLLHGTDDNVIPAMESTVLARHLQDNTKVRALITSLITHAEIDRPPTAREMWDLVTFWSDVLNR